MEIGIDSFAAMLTNTNGTSMDAKDSMAQLLERIEQADRVRVCQNFATLDLISQGRAEMVVGRGSFIESFPLFGLELEDYDALFTEKLNLLLKLRENEFVHWSG